MENKLYKSTGISLIIGSILLVATMVLHPVKGNADHILRIFNLAVFTHTMAIVSILFLAFGFLGLCKILSNPNGASLFAYCSLAMALIAGMFAGTINGLLIPYYIKSMTNAGMTGFDDIIKFGFIFNKCLDYILVSGLILSILIWSILMIQKKLFPNWIGYLGIIISLAFFLGIGVSFDYSSLWGFSLFVFAIATWIVSTGYFMISKSKEGTPQESISDKS